MALPYPTKVILPFDIATAQDMNERHANDVALANGSGLDDGAVSITKLDSNLASFFNRTWSISSTYTSANTDYTNTFGYPIEVKVIVSRASNLSINTYLRVAGILVDRVSLNDTDAATSYATLSATIPPGAIWRIETQATPINIWRVSILS